MKLKNNFTKMLLLYVILAISFQISSLPGAFAYNTGPEPIGTWNPDNSLDAVMDVAVNGNYAYLAVDSFGLQILDISTPATPTDAGSKVFSGSIKTITYANNKVYMGVGDKLHIYDVTNPASITGPTIIDQHSTVYGIFVVGNDIFIADHSGSLMIANHTANRYPQSHSMWVTNDYWVYDVVVSGNYAYAATSTQGCVVWNVTDKTAPVKMGKASLLDNVYAIGLIDSNTVLVGGRAGYIAKVDVTNKASPTKLGDLDTTSDIGKGKGISIAGTSALLADYSLGITTVFISSNTPSENTRLQPTARGYGVENDGTNVYGAMGFYGFKIWNLASAIAGFDLGEIPGFELMFAMFAIFAVILFLKMKKPKKILN